MELNNKKILIIGIAKSGISAAKLCHKLGGNVTLYDAKERECFEEIISELKPYNFKYIFGDFDDTYITMWDLLVMSPGVPMDLGFIVKAKELGIRIIGEIELAYKFCESDILAITGTNGKTTTTSLVGEIMSAYNKDTYVVGNIGNPFTDIALEAKQEGIVVAEVSSFQLETIEEFKPKVSAILNLTEDHLNRHKTFENYINTKLRITENQNENDYCILNYDCPYCHTFEYKMHSKVLWFSTQYKVEGAYYQEGKIYTQLAGKTEMVINMEEAKIFGTHNIQNIMAAVLLCLCFNVPIDIIRNVVYTFKGVEHRIEYVSEIKGVKYYNDSKATNPDAAIIGIKAMPSSTVIIAGGMDKGSGFEEWINAFDNKVKALIVFGETKQKIHQAALKRGFNNVVIVNDLEEAVFKAFDIAVSGDNVLLSPACASWDMFKSYEERGNLFKQLVLTL